MAELPKNSPQWDKFELDPEMLKGLGGVLYPAIDAPK
jgi:hypothetical protein